MHVRSIALISRRSPACVTSSSLRRVHFHGSISAHTPTRIAPRSNSSVHRNRKAFLRQSLRSSFTLTAIGAAVIVTGATLIVSELCAPSTSKFETTPSATANAPGKSVPTGDPVDPLVMPVLGNPPAQIHPGRPGNLTPEQEIKLKELWIEVGKLTGQYAAGTRVSVDGRPTSPATSTTADDASSTPGSTKEKKKRRGFGSIIGRHKDKGEDDSAGGGADDVADKHGSNKEFRTALQSMSPTELRDALWEFSKGDDPDANMCRYLRARKWNVHESLVMLISTIYWRARVMKLDEDIMTYGEESAARAAAGETDPLVVGTMDKKLGSDMLTQLRMGKSFLHGVDLEGRPMCFVRVKLHKGGEHSEQSLERLTVYMIETARFMLRPPVDTAVIVFDMTGFSLANMDYSPVKFMIKVFEANYPESLGAVLVHKAPWVFQGIWTVIKGWLDPVVASKITFTKDISDLSKFVDVRNVPRELGGDEDWEYKYVEPVPGENVQMGDKQARGEILEERQELLRKFEQNTEDWVMGNRPAEDVKSQRQKLSQALRDNYWHLDPFVRSRSMYDRVGILGEGGKVDIYPTARPSKPAGMQVPAQRQADGAGEQQPSKSVAGAGAAFGGGSSLEARESADARSLKSTKSTYYDAQGELD